MGSILSHGIITSDRASFLCFIAWVDPPTFSFLAVDAGEVGPGGLDHELVEVVDVLLDVARVVHFPLDRLRHGGAVDEPFQDRAVSSSIDARGDVELVVEVT